MKPTSQTILGPHGNCFSACVASLLELPIAEVPHFTAQHRPDAYELWLDSVNAWLGARGLSYFELEIPQGFNDAWARVAERIGYHILLGESPRSRDCSHAVIANRRDVVFDPHPDRTGLAPGWRRAGVLTWQRPSALQTLPAMYERAGPEPTAGDALEKLSRAQRKWAVTLRALKDLLGSIGEAAIAHESAELCATIERLSAAGREVGAMAWEVHFLALACDPEAFNAQTGGIVQ